MAREQCSEPGCSQPAVRCHAPEDACDVCADLSSADAGHAVAFYDPRREPVLHAIRAFSVAAGLDPEVAVRQWMRSQHVWREVPVKQRCKSSGVDQVRERSIGRSVSRCADPGGKNQELARLPGQKWPERRASAGSALPYPGDS